VTGLGVVNLIAGVADSVGLITRRA